MQINPIEKYSLYTDGGSRGNPGPSAAGGVILSIDGTLIHSYSKFLGISTNNRAEYEALLQGLQDALGMGIERLQCFADSELLVKQLNFEYKIKDRILADLFARIHVVRDKFKFIVFSHISRDKNRQADAQVNLELDKHR